MNEPNAEYINQLVKTSAIALVLQDNIEPLQDNNEVFTRNFKQQTKHYQQLLDKKSVDLFSQGSQELADYLNIVSTKANDICRDIFSLPYTELGNIAAILAEYKKQLEEKQNAKEDDNKQGKNSDS